DVAGEVGERTGIRGHPGGRRGVLSGGPSSGAAEQGRELIDLGRDAEEKVPHRVTRGATGLACDVVVVGSGGVVR
ncbi:hypothetical protein G3I15_09460, partial [Streptomyces sp. SID10244]|nr:hypothetical protein [Streptomyces sp. SID10244]